MDEDGFYIGELNDVRGLVPSNFLQPANFQQGFNNAKSAQLMANSGITTGPGSNSSFDQQSIGGGVGLRPKGVAFSDAKKPPLRQTSQQGSIGCNPTTNKPVNTGGTGMTSKANKIVGSTPAMINPSKQLTKKPSDLSTKALSNPAKKSSQGKKTDGALKVNFF